MYIYIYYYIFIYVQFFDMKKYDGNMVLFTYVSCICPWILQFNLFVGLGGDGRCCVSKVVSPISPINCWYVQVKCDIHMGCFQK